MFSDPVVGPDFFGREEVLDTLRKRVEAFVNGYRQNVALIGHQKLGKTSVLHQLLYSFHSDGLLPVYVELKPRSLEAFVDQFIRSLLFEYLRRKQSIDSVESFDTLIQLARGFIPQSAQEITGIKNDLKRGDPESAYVRLFELTSCVHKETGLRSIVILDEFHLLGEFGVKNAFQNFGKRLMLQKDTMYVISSSSFTISRRILAEKLSLLFGHFERINLEPFPFEVADAFIDKKLTGLAVSDDVKKYLISLTDGHPFFLNAICRQMRQAAVMGSRPAADAGTLVESLQRLFFDSEGILNHYYLNAIARWPERHRVLLAHMACGTNRLKELSQSVLRSARETSRCLKELTEAELVVKNGVFYHFHDKLFRFWLKYVYQPKELSLLVDTPSKAAHFRLECLKSIDSFRSASRLPARERIANLLKSFHGDRVEFDSKGKLLPAFNEVVIDAGPAGGEPAIIARTRGQSWICQVIERKSTEKDVLDFLKRAPGSAKARMKKVLITLDGMEHNAKLLAKNKKIWTLNLQKINALMDLYGQTKIVSVKIRGESAPAPIAD